VLEFEDAVEQHQRRVYSFACYWLGDREEAADLTQDVLLRLWRHWTRIRPETVGAWLIRTTRNACYDRLRRRRLSRLLFAATAEPESLERVPADCALEPEAQLGARRLQERLGTAIRALREPHRSVVILREIQGATYREIAQALDLPINSVKVYLHRGRRELRQRLADERRGSHAEATAG
jgi:RNA polymerase sigma-70 factor, ECF subfamily